MDKVDGDQLSGSSIKEAMLAAVAAESLDQIDPDFDEHSRFVIAAVRAVARRENSGLCAIIYSEAPMPDGKEKSFSKIRHMQDGHGEVANSLILTSRDANNGAVKVAETATVDGIMDEVEELGFGERATVFWDESARVATVYPQGVAHDTDHLRFNVPVDDPDITQDDVCDALNEAYETNLKNPSAGTARLFTSDGLIHRAEDEIERHLKGQLTMFYAGQKRRINIIKQVPTGAGRTDLILVQRPTEGTLPQLSGVIELKVLRGGQKADWEATAEGLRQGYHYRREMELPFATLALYDVTESPTADLTEVLAGQSEDHTAEVRTRRFPIYNSPHEWRIAQAA